MKTVSTHSQDFNTSGLRLDAGYYASTGVQAALMLEKWRRGSSRNTIEKLHDVCVPAGYFIPGRFKRTYVTNNEHGAPYLTAGNILQVNPLADARLLSRKYTPNWDELVFQERMTLITCSGTIGNAVYVNKELLSAVGSPDLLRIVADPKKIAPGYLFAVLSSSIGRALIQQKAYGAVIPHVESHHVKDLPIPRIDAGVERNIHLLIEQASQLWVTAAEKFSQAKKYFDYLLTDKVQAYFPHNYDLSIVSLDGIEGRIGGHYHSNIYRQVEHEIREKDFYDLGNLSLRIFTPPPFKHIYLSTPNRFPFVTGGELVNRRFRDVRYLSAYGMDDITDYVVQDGSLAIYKSGQLDSMLGTAFYIDKRLDGFCLSDHVIRVLIDPNKIHAMYVYAFLSTYIGRLLVIRRAMGKSVPFVREDTVATIPIPILNKKQQNLIVSLITEVISMRQESLKLEDQAQSLFMKQLEIY